MPDFELISNFEENVAHFSAAKRHFENSKLAHGVLAKSDYPNYKSAYLTDKIELTKNDWNALKKELRNSNANGVRRARNGIYFTFSTDVDLLNLSSQKGMVHLDKSPKSTLENLDNHRFKECGEFGYVPIRKNWYIFGIVFCE